MFTLQAPIYVSQMEDLSQDTRDKLMRLLGNCSQPLEHRGPITQYTETPNAPTINVWEQGAGPTVNEIAATQIVANNTSKMDVNLTQVQQGFTQFSPGVSWFQWLMCDFLVAKNFDWVDIDVVTDITVNTQSCTISVTKETIRVLKRTAIEGVQQHPNNDDVLSNDIHSNYYSLNHNYYGGN